MREGASAVPVHFQPYERARATSSASAPRLHRPVACRRACKPYALLYLLVAASTSAQQACEFGLTSIAAGPSFLLRAVFHFRGGPAMRVPNCVVYSSQKKNCVVYAQPYAVGTVADFWRDSGRKRRDCTPTCSEQGQAIFISKNKLKQSLFQKTSSSNL